VSAQLPTGVVDVPELSMLLDRLRKDLEVLPDKPDETPETTFMCLWALAIGRALAVSQIAGESFEPPSAAAQEKLHELIERRLTGTPLAHLTGRQDFMGLVLLSSPAALVPRRETELLGYAAAHKVRASGLASPLVVDVCTGAGNLALGIANAERSARVFASDLSADAIELARANGRHIAREDVTFRCGDLLKPFEEPSFLGNVDVLVCNPPYISSTRVTAMPREIAEHEPRLAFDGGPFGVNLLRRLIAEAPTYLKPGGWLLFEVGQGQGEQAARLAAARSFEAVESLRDAGGAVRAIAARKPHQPL
jgi:release factor glutamine methyltransferase